MSTSLSRHLFRLDEVAAALRYAIIERRIEEGMYWTLELIESEEINLLLETLLEVWVFTIGTARLAVFPVLSKIAQTMKSPDAGACAGSGTLLMSEFLLDFVYKILRLPKSCRDGSLLSIATLAREDLQHGGIDVKMEEMMVDMAGVQENCKSAIRRGDARVAARWIWRMPAVARVAIRGCVNAERRPLQAACRGAGQTFADALGRRFSAPIWGPLWDILEVLVLCMPADAYAESTKPLLGSASADLQMEIRRWQSLVGRRRRRCFAVPTAALKWITVRGRSTYTPTNFGELREPWLTMGGCAYWRRKASEFGCEVVGNAISTADDDAWEGFCAFAFPDDIPDEWSAADQAWSHGEGYMAPGFQPSRPNWFRSWFPETSAAGPANSKILLNRILESVPCPLEYIWMDEWLASF
jgi:hypothetical protein